MMYRTHDEEFVADELLPCPFCGNLPDITFIGNKWHKVRQVTIKCHICMIEYKQKTRRMCSYELAKIMITKWNTRYKEVVE